MELSAVPIEKADGMNVIIGQAHFIKTIEDVHEVLAMAGGLRFGVAFCEASGPCLIRRSGNDEKLVDLAVRNAEGIGAGHALVIVLSEGFPVSVLNALKQVPEVCSIFCATANDVRVIVAGERGARGVIGVIDGSAPRGIEGEKDQADRRAMLRRFGYKQ